MTLLGHVRFSSHSTHLTRTNDCMLGKVQEVLLSWQALTPSTGPGSVFYAFCDALEVKNGVSADANGWGLDHAISAWAKYWNETYHTIGK